MITNSLKLFFISAFYGPKYRELIHYLKVIFDDIRTRTKDCFAKLRSQFHHEIRFRSDNVLVRTGVIVGGNHKVDFNRHQKTKCGKPNIESLCRKNNLEPI